MKKLLSSFLSIIAFFLITAPAYAMTTMGGQAVYIPKDQVISGTLFAGGKSLVTIDGIVHGDVFCGSQTVVITGTVDGDVICVAQTIRIDGTVGGSLRAAGQSIELAGPIARNVTVIGQTLTIDPTGTISGEILGATEHTFIDGKVAGDVSLVVASLNFGDSAKVKGSVHYQSKTTAVVAPSATIAGTLTHTVPKTPAPAPVSPVKRVTDRTGGVVGKIILYFIVAAIIVALAPKRTKTILDLMKASPVEMGLKGLLALIGSVIVIIVVAVTIIGIPIAILLGITLFFVIVAAEVFVSLIVGRFILDKLNANRENNMWITILVGVPVTSILFAIPILGALARFLGGLWGFGAIVASRKATGKGK